MKTYRWMLVVMMVFLFGAVRANAQNPLLRELAKEDVDSRSGKTITRSDDERRKIVIEMIGKGELKGPEDKYNAGLVLQHTGMTWCEGTLVSLSPDNYLIAHFLFQSAYDGGFKKEQALYLIAASMDRYLSMTVGTQKYGTNREYNQKTGKEEWVPIDRNTTDVERAKYGLPPLAVMLKQFPEQAAPKKAWK